MTYPNHTPFGLSLSKPLPFFEEVEPPSTARLRQALRTGFDKLRANGAILFEVCVFEILA